MFMRKERKKIIMPEEKESTITTPEAAVISALSEEELKKITGGAPPVLPERLARAFTPEQIEAIEHIAAGKAPTTLSRGSQAAVGTALGFGANYVGTLNGNMVHKKKQ
jgi:hypothetical protein